MYQSINQSPTGVLANCKTGFLINQTNAKIVADFLHITI